MKLDGIDLISNERARQQNEKGYDAEHNEAHAEEQLAWAAACYAAPARLFAIERVNKGSDYAFYDPWPFNNCHDKRPRDDNEELDYSQQVGEIRIRLLVKAGALIAAEIDRLLRLQKEEGNKQKENYEQFNCTDCGEVTSMFFLLKTTDPGKIPLCLDCARKRCLL